MQSDDPRGEKAYRSRPVIQSEQVSIRKMLGDPFHCPVRGCLKERLRKDDNPENRLEQEDTAKEKVPIRS